MGAPSLTKLEAADLATVCGRGEISGAAAKLVESCDSVPEAIEQLIAGAFLLEAARLFAHGLPRREAVWWACMCAAHTAPPDLPEADRAAEQGARDWVRRQSDDIRRAAMKSAERAGFLTPEAWTAAAAFFSGDSLSAPELPKVPPAPNLTGLAVAGSVVLSSVRARPERQAARLARFLDSARDIAGGGAGHLAAEQA